MIHNVPKGYSDEDQDCCRACSITNQTVVVGLEAVQQALADLTSEIKYEVATFAPGAAHTYTNEDLNHSQSRNKALYSGNIRARTIYLSSVRKNQTLLAHVKWLNERGAEVRTASKLPIRAIIFDRQVAVLPLDVRSANQGIVVHRSSSVVIPLQELFEKTWSHAQPLGMARLADGKSLTEEERAILELAALGNTDVEIGVRLGISDRTIRRRVQELQHQLGADSRIKAIYLATKKGLI